MQSTIMWTTKTDQLHSLGAHVKYVFSCCGIYDKDLVPMAECSCLFSWKSGLQASFELQ